MIEPAIPDTWCPAPWTNLALTHDGSYAVCNIGPKISIDDSGKIRGDELEQVKAAMLRGERLKACDKCWFQERNGAISHRLELIKRFNGKVDPWLVNDPNYDPRFFFDLSLSNKCNQKCRICGPNNSTGWFKDATAIDDLTWSHVYGSRQVRSASDRVPQLINMMKQSSDWLDLEIKGGDPLYLPETRQLLQEMINNGLHDRTEKLKFMTNGTAYDDEILDILRHFPCVDISISIDAVGKLHEYTRSPNMNWDDCRRKWQHLANLPNRRYLMISNTIYIYNIFDQINLTHWVQAEFGEDTKMANVILQRPLYLSCKIMTPEIKRIALAHLIRHPDLALIRGVLEDDIHEDDVRPLHSKKTHLSAWEVYSRTTTLRQKFAVFTKRLDKLRGEDITSLVPELTPMLDAYSFDS